MMSKSQTERNNRPKKLSNKTLLFAIAINYINFITPHLMSI